MAFIETWVAKVLQNRADMRWAPLVAVAPDVQEAHPSLGGLQVFVDEQLGPGVVEIRVAAEVSDENGVVYQTGDVVAIYTG